MTIKLNLLNFRRYKNYELELPETGFVRLHGASNSGKTTILQSIAYALYGKCPGDITTWGEKTSKVSLTGFGLDITRTRGPNEVSCNGVFADQADELIKSTLGMNKLEFELSSYVRQMAENSILSLSPSEQLSVIHQLAFKDKNPNDVKDKIKSTLTQTTVDLQKAENELGLIHASIRDTQSQITSEGVKIKDLAITRSDNSHDEISHLSSRKAKFSADLSELSTRYEHLNGLHKSKVYVDIQKCYLKIAQNPQEIEKKESWLSNNPPPENEVYLSDKLTDAIERRKILTEERSKLLSLYETLKNKVQYDETRTKYWQSFKRNHIATSKNDAQELNKDDLSNLSIAAERMSDFILPGSISENPALIKEQAESKLLELRAVIREIEDFELIKKRNIERWSDINRIQAELKTLNEHLAFAKRYVEKNSDIPSQAELASQLHEISVKKEEVLSNINAIDREVSEHRVQMQRQIQIQDLESRVFALNEKLSSLELRRIEKEAVVTDLRVKIENLSKLADLSVKCGLDVVSRILDEINVRAKYWSDLLLDNDVVASLIPFKELKSKKEIVDKISLDVYYKGTKLSNYLSDLSGGQRSRLTASFSLAFPDLYNSPILILDEAFTGVDPQTLMDCLEAIHPIAQRKLILIVDHSACGYEFDHVIDCR
jgi:DNA repair exonuclease SbcCD ATPase subunit